MTRSTKFKFGFFFVLLMLSGQRGAAQLLDGEFGDIDLGRELIEPAHFPTVRELRALVEKPKIQFVAMLKLYGDENNHHLPVWSHDGNRLAFQRSRVGKNESKLLLFDSLAEEKPTLLTNKNGAYDFSFRWGLNGTSSYVFTRIDASTQQSQIMFSVDGQEPVSKSARPGKFFYPTLYERTDGIWRLAYENNGQIVQEAWTLDEEVQSPLPVAHGTAARWNRSGRNILMARELRRSGHVGMYEVVARNLRTDEDTVVPATREENIRSPMWSPDETHVAWFARYGGESEPWQIRFASLAKPETVQSIARDVVVNPDFKTEGPSWEPSGERIWFFSHGHRQQAYYPIVAAGVTRSETVTVDYPKKCTTPNDLTINPVTGIPEIAFVGHSGVSQDLYIVFLNHF